MKERQIEVTETNPGTFEARFTSPKAPRIAATGASMLEAEDNLIEYLLGCYESRCGERREILHTLGVDVDVHSPHAAPS